MSARKPLCGQCQDGWVVDPETFAPVRRCPCRFLDLDGADARDQGIAAATGANPDAMRAALRIIRETALVQPTVNANDVRHRMRLAQIPGEVVGAAFRQAAKDRVLRRIGYVASTDPATHAHPVVDWASAIYRPTGQEAS